MNIDRNILISLFYRSGKKWNSEKLGGFPQVKRLLQRKSHHCYPGPFLPRSPFSKQPECTISLFLGRPFSWTFIPCRQVLWLPLMAGCQDGPERKFSRLTDQPPKRTCEHFPGEENACWRESLYALGWSVARGWMVLVFLSAQGLCGRRWSHAPREEDWGKGLV